jgi:DNA-binding SARP family transcriptional activator/WD40 repeat protein
MVQIARCVQEVRPDYGDLYRTGAALGYRPGVWFGVLGHLEVRRTDGSPLPISGPARRQLLAALISRPGALVSVTSLIEDLWASAPPRSALNSLRSHVVRVRAALAQGDAGNLLRTEGEGYRLCIEATDVDAGRFEALIDAAARTPDAGAAIARYDEALALWRGDAYAEFGDAPFAVLERIRLGELRATARERRTDLALAAGAAGELVAELEQRVRAEPYRERGWEQLALALYRAGRQADALAACRRARDVLLEDLGVDPSPGLRALEERLLRQDPDLVVPAVHAPTRPTVDRCPYLGLGGYEEQDAELFVGRERLTSTLAGRLADQSVLVVTGASGVGKSSLVRAGLVPALRAGALPGSPAWRIDVRTPGEAPLADGGRRPDLLVLDQAEELFTAFDPALRDDLMGRLARYVEEQDGRLVFVLRSDYYGRLADVPTLAAFAEKTALLVGPMRADELRRALLEPAAAAGLRLEDELVETIMDDAAGQPEPLPLLSEAMVRTWQRRAGDLLTLDAYRSAGELAGALEAAAEECYAGLSEEQQRAARHVLVRMATRTESGWVRRPLTRAAPADAAERQALTALIAARLVVADERRIEITHDALLGHWPRLRDWLEERSLAADLLEHLDQAATAWRAAGRQDTDLYRGPRLSAAVDWRGQHPEELSAAEEEFLDASATAADAELAVARAQTRRFRTIAAVLAAVVVVAVVAAVLAVQARSDARRQATRAQQAALTADARRLAALSANAPDIATSSLLAVAAYRLQDTPDSRAALFNAVVRNQSALWRMPFSNRPNAVVATPDGRMLAVADNEPRVWLVDLRTRKRVGNFPTQGFVYGFTSDARQVVSYYPLNAPEPMWRLAAYDVATGKEHTITDGGDPSTPAPAVTSDGRWVVLIMKGPGGAHDVVDVFDSRDWNAPPRQFRTSGAPFCPAAGRSAIATEDTDGSVTVRAVPSLRVLGRLPGVPGAQANEDGCPAVSGDGSEIARVDPLDARRVMLYRTRSGAASVVPLPTDSQSVGAIRFSPDDSEVAVSSRGGSLAVYRLDGSQVSSYAGQAGAVNSLAWTGVSRPTGLYTAGLDGDLVSWDLNRSIRTLRAVGPPHPPVKRGLRFGRWVVGDTQQDGTTNSHRMLFAVDTATGAYHSWPAGLTDDEGIAQTTVAGNGSYALVNVESIYGGHTGVNRVPIFDLRTQREVGHLQLSHPWFPDGYDATVSADGRRAYCNCAPQQNRIEVFALPSGRALFSIPVRFAGADARVIEPECWYVDPRGRVVVFGWDPKSKHQRLGLVDVRARRLVAQTDLGAVSPPTAIAWSPDRRTVALGSDTGSVILYDADTLAPRTAPVTVTSGFVGTLSFAPDGQLLLVGGTDGTLRFLTVPDLAPQGQPLEIGDSGNNGGVYAWYTASGDVAGLAEGVGSIAGGQQSWFTLQVAPAKLAALACQLAGADITRAQWQRYVGDRPYRHVCTG